MRFVDGEWEKGAENTQERGIQQSILEKYDDDALKNIQHEKEKEAEMANENEKDKIKFR